MNSHRTQPHSVRPHLYQLLDNSTTPLNDVYLVGIASPLNFRISTTKGSAICLGHAAVNTGLADGPDAKPTKMCHLHKSMQKAVQDTACCLLTVISISGPSPFGSTPVSQGLLPHPNYLS